MGLGLFFINVFFATLVVGVICGMHVWAIATQHRDWPQSEPPETSTTEVIAKPVEVVPGSAVIASGI